MIASTDGSKLFPVTRSQVEYLLLLYSAVRKQHEQTVAAFELTIYAFQHDLEHTLESVEEICQKHHGDPLSPLINASYSAAKALREKGFQIFGGYHPMCGWHPPKPDGMWGSQLGRAAETGPKIPGTAHSILLEPRQMAELASLCLYFSDEITYSSISINTAVHLLQLPVFVRRLATYGGVFLA